MPNGHKHTVQLKNTLLLLGVFPLTIPFPIELPELTNMTHPCPCACAHSFPTAHPCKFPCPVNYIYNTFFLEGDIDTTRAVRMS